MTDKPATSIEPMNSSVESRSFWIRYRWRIILAACLAILGYWLYTPQHLLRLPDGSSLIVLQADYNTFVQLDPTSGQRFTENRLLVKYYSNLSTMEQMQNEARSLVPKFFAVADQNGLKAIVLKPSVPIFTQSFPLAIKSYYVRFIKSDNGEWKEKAYQ